MIVVHPCQEQIKSCVPVGAPDAGNYSYLPKGLVPLRIDALYLSASNRTLRDLSRLTFEFDFLYSPMSQYAVVDLTIDFDQYESLNGSSLFMSRNFPFVKSLQVRIDGDNRTSITEDFFKGMRYLQTFTFLKSILTDQCGEFEDFLFPFSFNASGSLKSVYLDSPGCNLTALSMGRLPSLREFTIGEASAGPSVYLSPSTGTAVMFPLEMVTIDLGSDIHLFEWLCGEYYKARDVISGLGTGGKRNESQRMTLKRLNLGAVSGGSWSHHFPNECQGMFDLFFNLPGRMSFPLVTKTGLGVDKTTVLSSSQTGSELLLGNAVFSGILVEELIHRYWGMLDISGFWNVSHCYFPPSLTDMKVLLVDNEYSYGSGGETVTVKHPVLYVPYVCVTHKCSIVEIKSENTYQTDVLVELYDSPETIETAVSTSVSPLVSLFINAQVNSPCRFFEHFSFPNLKKLSVDGQCADDVFGHMVNSHVDFPSIELLSLECSASAGERIGRSYLKESMFRGMQKMTNLASACPIKGIERNAFGNLLLNNIQLWDERWRSNYEQELDIILPIFSPLPATGLRFSLYFGYYTARNLTEPFIDQTVKGDFYVKFLYFHTKAVQVKLSEALPSVCDNEQGSCRGLKTLDLSDNQMTNFDVNVADIFLIPALLGKTFSVTQYINGVRCCIAPHDVHITDDLLPVDKTGSRNLTNYYKTLENWETDYEMPISRLRNFEIYLGNSSLSYLLKDAFYNLRSLTELHLAENAIVSIERGFLSGKTCIAHGCNVNLTGNPLTNITDEFVNNITATVREQGTPLRGLYLSHTGLNKFPFGLGVLAASTSKSWETSGHSSAFVLDVSHNNITEIKDSMCNGMDTQMEGILVVNLTNNDIAYLSQNAFDCPSGVNISVYLDNNPRLSNLPSEATYITQLQFLSAMDTGLKTENIPCVYEMGGENEIRLNLVGLSLGNSTLPRAMQMQSFNCCLFWQFAHNYAEFSRSDESERKGNDFNITQEGYEDFLCANGSSIVSFAKFYKEVEMNNHLCERCSQIISWSVHWKVFFGVFITFLVLYLVFCLTLILLSKKISSAPLSTAVVAFTFSLYREKGKDEMDHASMSHNPYSPYTPSPQHRVFASSDSSQPPHISMETYDEYVSASYELYVKNTPELYYGVKCAHREQVEE